jgi:murein DD-endopeptidase MepM/ murein hydrolase activator NlpD
MTPREWRRDLRTFAVGSAFGFLTCALLVTELLLNFNLIWWLPPMPVQAQLREERVAAVLEPVGAVPTATVGRAAVPAPAPPSPAHSVIGPEPTSASELKERDLLVPVEGVVSAQLNRDFSDPRGGSRRHEALDILAPRHTPVRAVEAGTIARLFYSKAGGITVYQFDPTSTFCYYYAHLERYADGLREGASVGKGQIIGYVGTSGNAPKNTPHLHFAIFRLTEEKRWWEGTPIDPYDVLR